MRKALTLQHNQKQSNDTRCNNRINNNQRMSAIQTLQSDQRQSKDTRDIKVTILSTTIKGCAR